MAKPDEILITNQSLLRPKIGELFFVTLAGIRKPVTARLIGVDQLVSTLKVVPDGTKD